MRFCLLRTTGGCLRQMCSQMLEIQVFYSRTERVRECTKAISTGRNVRTWLLKQKMHWVIYFIDDGRSVCLFYRDVSKFAMHFIVEEIDEDTSMEELQKMMLVAFVYRILVCFYEVSQWEVTPFKSLRAVRWQIASFFQIVCIWGAGGATPGKFLVGLRVVTCDSSVLVQPDRVLVVPATNVSLSAWVVGFQSLSRHFVFFSHLSSFTPNELRLFLQISRSSLEQELFNCLLFPSLHHASLLPAQQDCVRYGRWNYCGKALQSQMMHESHVVCFGKRKWLWNTDGV